ncbi:hypothetical protein [Leptospira santarosai]|nr:hypothetical protein [Leptospira santarosai]
MRNESGLQTICLDILLESLPKAGFGKFALILSAFGVGVVSIRHSYASSC